MLPHNCDLDIHLNTVKSDQNGRILLIGCILEGTTLVFVNIYALTKDHILQQVNFISELDDLLQTYLGKNVLLGGGLLTLV